MNLGIDFETTNLSVARFDGNQLYRLGIDPANDNPNVLPSLIYIDRTHHAVVGAKAAMEYLDHETGRAGCPHGELRKPTRICPRARNLNLTFSILPLTHWNHQVPSIA